jgi:hypothetical protein
VDFKPGEEAVIGSQGSLRLRLPKPYGEFEMKGRVVWVGNSDGKPTAGIEFTEFIAQAEDILGKIVARALSEGRST